MNFDKCDPPPPIKINISTPQIFLMPLSSHPPAPCPILGNHRSDFRHCKVTVHILELHVNGIIGVCTLLCLASSAHGIHACFCLNHSFLPFHC